MNSVVQNIEAVRERIQKAAKRAGRDPDSIRLLAVSKRKPVEDIREAYDAGLRDFGENYVQEALTKMDLLPPDINWHMIGHLQSNKAKRVVDGFAILQTLDRLSLAKALDKAAGAIGVWLPVLLQVNIGDELSKAGVDEAGMIALATDVAALKNLRVKGLMAIPPFCPDPDEARPHFRQLRQLGKRINDMNIDNIEMNELSMGMSHDFEVAIEEGATIVRVGSALFGPRD